jgi:hypothetical protein
MTSSALWISPNCRGALAALRPARFVTLETLFPLWFAVRY